jgi:acetoin utilization deacetylase AcuC-like enzyme
VATGYAYHEIFGWHDTSSYAGVLPSNPAAGLQPFVHMENAETKRRIHELVVVSGLIDHLVRIAPRPATDEEILRIHTADHLARIESESLLPKGGDAGDGISPFGQGGIEIARLAAGAVIECVDAVLDGRVDNAYALVRPPGHHAIASSGMGFCIFGNVAIAAAHARAVRGVERIAVVDWDVHHGNGTQAAFYGDRDVLTISIHQDNVFPPNSGYLDERGEGSGTGFALNVPLPPGTGDGGYVHVIDQVVVPAVRAFAPDLVVVASGFDAGVMDPLARQMVTSAGFRTMTERLLAAAADTCGGRVVMSHEGGYNPVYVPFCGLAVLEAMSGRRVLDDPFLPLVTGFAGHELKPAEAEVVAAAAEHVPHAGARA